MDLVNFLKRQVQRFMDFISVLLLCILVIFGSIFAFIVVDQVLIFVLNLVIYTFHIDFRFNLVDGAILIGIIYLIFYVKNYLKERK